MNEEELKQKAKGYVQNLLFWLNIPISKKKIEQGSLYFFELLKRITELEGTIEKMKGCHNCKHNTLPYNLCSYSRGDEDYDCDGQRWEIKEND